MLFQVVYTVVNIVRTYCVYELMHIFFMEDKEHKKKEVISYIIYDITVTLCFLLIHIPIVMLVCNMIGLYLLSFNYKEIRKKRIISITFIAFILMAVEAIVTVMTGNLNIPLFRRAFYSSEWGMISLQIVLFAVVQGLKKFQNIRNGDDIPMLYWVCIVTIPTVSLYISIMLLYADGLSIRQVTISQICLLWINVMMFVLYDGFIISFKAREEKKLLLQQNHYYEQQLELMQATEQSLRGMKHDWMNHISAMKELLYLNDLENLKSYFVNAEEEINQSVQSIRSGNTVVDSILNFKQREAQQKNIAMQINSSLPCDLQISGYDLTIILGNLVDNAIQASLELDSQNREIVVNMKYDVGMIVIKVENKYNGNLKYKKGILQTTKEHSEQHGFGLQNIRKVVEKNQGILKVEHDENTFQVTVMLLENRE